MKKNRIIELNDNFHHNKEQRDLIQESLSGFYGSIKKQIIENEQDTLASLMGFIFISGDIQLLKSIHEHYGGNLPALLKPEVLEDSIKYMAQKDECLDLMKYLIDTLNYKDLLKSIDPKTRDNLLKIACEYGARKTALYMIEKGLHKRENGAINNYNETPLHGAARLGDLDVLSKLINYYKSNDSEMIFMQNLQASDNFLHILNIFNHQDIYKDLIRYKVDLPYSKFKILINLKNKYNFKCTQVNSIKQSLKYKQTKVLEQNEIITNLSGTISLFYKSIFFDRDENLVVLARDALYGEAHKRQNMILSSKGEDFLKTKLMVEFLLISCIRTCLSGSFDELDMKTLIKIEVYSNIARLHKIKFELYVNLAHFYPLTNDTRDTIMKYFIAAKDVYEEHPDTDFKSDIPNFFLNLGLFCIRYNFYETDDNLSKSAHENAIRTVQGYVYIDKAVLLIEKNSRLQFNYRKDYTDVLEKIFRIHTDDGTKDLEDLLRIAELFPEKQMQSLYKLMGFLRFTNMPSKSLLNCFNFPINYTAYKDKSIFYKIQCESELREGRTENAARILTKALRDNCSKNGCKIKDNISELIKKDMHLHLFLKKYKEAYDLLKFLYKNYGEFFVSELATYEIKLYEALILEHNDLRDESNKVIDSSPSIRLFFIEQLVIDGCNAALEGDNLKAKNILDRVLDICIKAKIHHRYEKIINSLIDKFKSGYHLFEDEEDDEDDEDSDNTDEKTGEEIGLPDVGDASDVIKESSPENISSKDITDNNHVNISSIKTLDDLNKVIDVLSGKQIHDWFQKQKLGLRHSANKEDEIINSAKQYSWIIGDKVYISSNSKCIYQNNEAILKYLPTNSSRAIPSGSGTKYCLKTDNIYKIHTNYYASIDPDLLEIMEKSLVDKFTNALKHGFVKDSRDDQGLKMINHKLIELKIFGKEYGDNRLYTTSVYKNELNESLVLFNKLATHEEIKKIISSKSKLETIAVESLKDDFMNEVWQDSNDPGYYEPDILGGVGIEYGGYN